MEKADVDNSKSFLLRNNPLKYFAESAPKIRESAFQKNFGCATGGFGFSNDGPCAKNIRPE